MIDEKKLSAEDIRKQYRPRLIDARIEKLLSIFGGIQIVGPKWCGKSWTGTYHSESVINLGEEEVKRRALLEPRDLLRGEYPMLVDEWQVVPNLMDVARLNIDFSARKGMYIFAGSTTPPKGSVMHSGAGRFARIKMHTMSLFESGDSSGKVSLSDLFDGDYAGTVSSSLDYYKAVCLICRGGWPGSIGEEEEDALKKPKAYIDMISGDDALPIDGKRRNKALIGKLMLSLARNTSTPASMKTLANDMAEGGKAPSEPTVTDYLDALKKIFLVEEQHGWRPNLRSATRLQSSPRRHLADPSLAAALLCNGPGELRQDPNTAGFLFESMCYRDLCIYASALGGEVFYYKEENGLEADFIIQLKDGRWGAAEAKMGVYEFEKSAKNLLKVKEKMVAGGLREPSFLMILNVTGGVAHIREDGVVEVPIDCFGP